MIKIGSAQKKILKALEIPSTNVSYFHDMNSLVLATGLLVGSIQRAVNKLVDHGLVSTKNLIREPANGRGLPKRYKVYMDINNSETEKALVEVFKKKAALTAN
ncbi:MAG TPA: hypothetical protein EYN54_12305 [Methylococcaceae bacterium]|nr:hypothetical protein [Methylococcaceae bacterium]